MSDAVEMARVSWPAYRDRIAHNAIVIVPIGALEQHGHHLPLGVDGILATEISRRVARRVDGLVAPTLAYGFKSQPRTGGGDHFPGTTSLDAATLDRPGPRRVDGAGPSRSDADRHRGRPLRERDVSLRRGRPGDAPDASGADRRREDREAPVLRGGRPGDDRPVVARRLPRDGARARRVDGDVDDAVPGSGTGGSGGRPRRTAAVLPSLRCLSPDHSWVPPSGALSSPHRATAAFGEHLVDRFVSLVASALEREFR